nr:MAG TPA: hypothetical protein [Caudoviricetes sp.]
MSPFRFDSLRSALISDSNFYGFIIAYLGRKINDRCFLSIF